MPVIETRWFFREEGLDTSIFQNILFLQFRSGLRFKTFCSLGKMRRQFSAETFKSNMEVEKNSKKKVKMSIKTIFHKGLHFLIFNKINLLQNSMQIEGSDCLNGLRISHFGTNITHHICKFFVLYDKYKFNLTWPDILVLMFHNTRNVCYSTKTSKDKDPGWKT